MRRHRAALKPSTNKYRYKKKFMHISQCKLAHTYNNNNVNHMKCTHISNI